MKLFYKVNPTEYKEMMNRVKEHFDMHEEVDEEKTMLLMEDETKIELVSGSYNPHTDDVASIRAVLVDESLREFFDSVFGEPYRVK